MKLDPKKLANEFIDSYGRRVDKIEEFSEHIIRTRELIKSIDFSGIPEPYKKPMQMILKESLNISENSLNSNKLTLLSMREMRTFFEELLKELK